MADAMTEFINVLAGFRVHTVVSTATLSSYLFKDIVGLLGETL